VLVDLAMILVVNVHFDKQMLLSALLLNYFEWLLMQPAHTIALVDQVLLTSTVLLSKTIQAWQYTRQVNNWGGRHQNLKFKVARRDKFGNHSSCLGRQNNNFFQAFKLFTQQLERILNNSLWVRRSKYYLVYTYFWHCLSYFETPHACEISH